VPPSGLFSTKSALIRFGACCLRIVEGVDESLIDR